MLINDNIFVIKVGENGHTSIIVPTVLSNLNVDIFSQSFQMCSTQYANSRNWRRTKMNPCPKVS